MLLPAVLAGALVVAACGEAEPGAVTVSIEGSVSSLVTTVPESTTTTAAVESTTTTVPGVDPGACVGPGETLIIALVEDVQPRGPCPVSTTGSIRFSNLTDQEATVQWGSRQLVIAPQRSVVPPESVGEVLSPGLHAFVTSVEPSPTVLVSSPEEGFGSAQVSLRSFGGVRPGQRISEVEKAVGASIVVPDRQSSCVVGWLAGDAHSPRLVLQGGGGDPLLVRADATTNRQRTLSGVGIGSTADEVRTTYGDQITETDIGDGLRLTFEPNESIDVNYRLVFDVGPDGAGDDRVVAMRIGRLGAVENPEPCG